MKTHLLELLLKRTELLSRFEPSYRPVQEVEQEIAETRAQIAAEALNPVRDETTDKDPNYEWARMEMEKAQVQGDGLRARQSDAAAQVASLRQVAQQMQSDSVDQQDLILAAKAEEDNYLCTFTSARKRASATRSTSVASFNVAIVEPPVVPALPVHSMLLYFLFAVGLAIALSVGIAFTTEYFDPTIRTPSEAHVLLGVPVLAWLPAPKATAPRPSLFRADRPKVVVR